MCMYHMTKVFQTRKVFSVVVGVLTCCALFYSKHDFKATEMNVTCSLIPILLLNEFKLDYNTMEATKKHSLGESEGAVDHCTLNSWLKKFCLEFKNFEDQARSNMSKTMHSKVVVQTLETNLACSTLRVSGKLGISKSSMVLHLQDLHKSIWSCWLLPQITNIYIYIYIYIYMEESVV